jgi:predicted deacylase
MEKTPTAVIEIGQPAGVAEPPSTAPGRELPRLLGTTGPATGPLLLCFGGMHGNEPSGAVALERILVKLRQNPSGLRGQLVALAGNRAGLQQKKRYIASDFNRHWTRERVARLRAAEGPFEAEDRELVELDREIAKATAGRNKVYALDLHSTSGEGPAFCILEDTLPNRRFALNLPVTIVVGIEEELIGTISHFLTEQGIVTCGFEAGQHEDPYSADRAEAAVWIMLEASGVLIPGKRPEVQAARELLVTQTGKLPHFTELRYRHNIQPGDEFRMKPGYRNFDAVTAGQPLARDSHGPVVSPLTGLILMPLYQPLGQDGFFIVTRVAPIFLTLSAFARHLRLEKVIHLLPGVKRHPERADAFVVDTQIARFLALKIFHLLGYRRISPMGRLLTMARRKHDD